MAEMSEEEFYKLCGYASFSNTGEEVMLAVSKDSRLLSRFSEGWSLLDYLCTGDYDNHVLADFLLKRGANMHHRIDELLICASKNGYIKVCSVLLDHGADPDSNNQLYSALSIAAREDNLQVCLLLISRRANLMLALTHGTALEVYGICKWGLRPDQIKQRCAILQTAFEQGPHPDMCWARRWPFICVMVGCGFQPLKARQEQLLLENPPLPHDVSFPPIEINTVEKYRAYLHGCIFAHPGLWCIIASYL